MNGLGRKVLRNEEAKEYRTSLFKGAFYGREIKES
jgi:hypothetical protein